MVVRWGRLMQDYLIDLALCCDYENIINSLMQMIGHIELCLHSYCWYYDVSLIALVTCFQWAMHY